MLWIGSIGIEYSTIHIIIIYLFALLLSIYIHFESKSIVFQTGVASSFVIALLATTQPFKEGIFPKLVILD